MDGRVVVETVRAGDRDRYLSALYAPEQAREDLMALYAFNAEVASIRDRVREGLQGEIRLQWWRDALEPMDGAAAAGNPLAEAVRAAIVRRGLPPKAFMDYLDARVFDLYDDIMPTRSDLEGYLGETAAALIQLSAMILDPPIAPAQAELSGRAGCAQGITGILRSLPLQRSRGQCYVAQDILAAAGSSREEFLSPGGGANGGRVVEALVALAREHLTAFERAAPALPPSLRPAFLPVSLCGPVLDRVARAGKAALDILVGLPDWRRQWILFRHAARGWR